MCPINKFRNIIFFIPIDIVCCGCYIIKIISKINLDRSDIAPIIANYVNNYRHIYEKCCITAC